MGDYERIKQEPNREECKKEIDKQVAFMVNLFGEENTVEMMLFAVIESLDDEMLYNLKNNLQKKIDSRKIIISGIDRRMEWEENYEKEKEK